MLHLHELVSSQKFLLVKAARAAVVAEQADKALVTGHHYVNLA